MNSQTTCILEYEEFSIYAKLEKDSLLVRLRDFTNDSVYSRIFNQKDIGQDIHKKCEPIDIFRTFSISAKIISDADQQKIKEGVMIGH